MKDELIGGGAEQNTPEFCRAWLGLSEGYIRTLRHNGAEPSVETLAICSHKLSHYADRFKHSTVAEHRVLPNKFLRL